MTQRQKAILRTIVEYYVQTAAPVGSLGLAQQFGRSSATIRADMAVLERSGYITHPHTSAGRIPTDKGYRHYVESLKGEEEHSLDASGRLRRAIDQRIRSAGQPQQAIRVTVESLANVTRNVAFSTMGEALYMRGYAQLFARPEFEESDDIQDVARLLDSIEPWLAEAEPEEGVSVYIGAENPIGKDSGCALIIARYDSPYSYQSYIGVVGPTRQSYSQVMNLVEHVSETLEEVLE